MHQMLQSTSQTIFSLLPLDMARHQLATTGNDLVSRAVELVCTYVGNSIKFLVLLLWNTRIFKSE